MNAKIALKGVVLLMAGSLLAACGGNDKTSEDANAVATVNGEAITEQQLAFYAERRAGMPLADIDAEMRSQVLDELINIRLLEQKAKRDGLHKQDPLKQELEFQRATALADAAMTGYLETAPVNEAAMREEYEKRKAELGGNEYKASHILLESEEDAKAVITELQNGADFTELAKSRSIEPGAEQSGGSLGWFSTSQMVKPFADAVASMEKGNVSETPVQTQFGWHVIRLEDSREVPPPAFEDVQPQIERYLTNQRIQAFINELRGKAEIDKEDFAAAAESGDEATTEVPEVPDAEGNDDSKDEGADEENSADEGKKAASE